MAKVVKRWGLLAGTGALVLALDQTVKYLVTERLAVGESWAPIPGLASYIRITRSYNTGAAFGMFPSASDFFLILALVTVVFFIVSYPRLPANALLSRISIALISGGALSNAIDRIRLGHVVDYVHVQLSPTFSNISNFADHTITVGVILLLVDQWLSERHRTAEEVSAEASAVGVERDVNPSESPLPVVPEVLSSSSAQGVDAIPTNADDLPHTEALTD